ncbi:MAG TPA: OsmC family protein [Stellaceae bacterium]|nr:OsmC family protein [Stellaceae bacterium]
MESQSEDKTFHYPARTTWHGARQGVLAAEARPDIAVGSPREWNGTGEQWAPEELLVGSVNSCIMLTFLTLAKARGVDLVGYDSDAEGTLEKVGGVYQMTKITIRPRIVVASEAQRDAAHRAMEQVEARCFMSQSVKAAVTLIPEISFGVPSR